MSFQIGDKIKYKPEIYPEHSSNIYVVIEKSFVNIAKQDTIKVKNFETDQELFKNPEDFQLL